MSVEQLLVVEACANGNCMVDSVAGSGKTTTCLTIAAAYPTEVNLLLTYNAKLKLDTRARVVRQGVTNLEVHSYHSFCVKFYNPNAFDDLVLTQLVVENTPPKKSFNYHRIILDETQDMTPLLHRVFCKLYRDNGPARLCVLGDQKQSIYEFRKADARYLTLAPNIFPGDWTCLRLSTTYRLTIPMAKFVNECMLKSDRLKAVKVSEIQPEYVICNAFDDTIFNRVVELLEEYRPEEIFLVAPSIRVSTCPLRKLENKLVKKNIPCFAPISDDEIVSDEVLKGKIALSTIHQTKGMERKVVVVFGFDDSYFKFFKRDADIFTCPNELYVAATRATERLILVHHFENGSLPFLCQTSLQPYIIQKRPVHVDDDRKTCIGLPEIPVVSVTGLLRHLDSEAMQKARAKLQCTTLVAPMSTPIKLDSKIQCLATVESVSHITGTAIPIFYEYSVKGKMSILEILTGREPFEYNVPRYNQLGYLVQAHKQPNRGLFGIQYPLTVPELLFTANCWKAETGGYLSQINQIQKYDWLTESTLTECNHRMDAVLRRLDMTPEAASFEVHAVKPANARLLSPTRAVVPHIHPDPFPELRGRVLNGFADLVGSCNLLEIKCTSALTIEHYLQLALYMYSREDHVGYLFNVFTNELVRVQCDELAEVVRIIMDAKYATKSSLSDEDFIRENKRLGVNHLQTGVAGAGAGKERKQKRAETEGGGGSLESLANKVLCCTICSKPGHTKKICPDIESAKPATPDADMIVEQGEVIGVFDVESSNSHVVNELGLVGVMFTEEGVWTDLADVDFHCVTCDMVKGWARDNCVGLVAEAAASQTSGTDMFLGLVEHIRTHKIKYLKAHNGVASDMLKVIRQAEENGVKNPIGLLEIAGLKGIIDPARFIPQHRVTGLQHSKPNKTGGALVCSGYLKNEDLFKLASNGKSMVDCGLRPHRALDDAKAERAWLKLPILTPILFGSSPRLPCAVSLASFRKYFEQYAKHIAFIASLLLADTSLIDKLR